MEECEGDGEHEAGEDAAVTAVDAGEEEDAEDESDEEENEAMGA